MAMNAPQEVAGVCGQWTLVHLAVSRRRSRRGVRRGTAKLLRRERRIPWRRSAGMRGGVSLASSNGAGSASDGWLERREYPAASGGAAGRSGGLARVDYGRSSGTMQGRFGGAGGLPAAGGLRCGSNALPQADDRARPVAAARSCWSSKRAGCRWRAGRGWHASRRNARRGRASGRMLRRSAPVLARRQNATRARLEVGPRP